MRERLDGSVRTLFQYPVHDPSAMFRNTLPAVALAMMLVLAVAAPLRRLGTSVFLSAGSVAGGGGSMLSAVTALCHEWATRLFALVGYQRFSDDDPLEHETRSTIYEYVRDSPGTSLAEIGDETAVPMQTARYHLRVLEFENLVSRKNIRGRRRYFPIGSESDELDAALNDEATAAVLNALATEGPDSVSGLAETVERDPSTVSHHLDRLEEDGLVEREREGRSVVNRLAADVERALIGGRVAEKPNSGPGSDPVEPDVTAREGAD
ncbi:winged helix-turn-helix transcriptional regulator [Natrarchaeobius sp. A-rgal3]|uniref:winged helix-turn-helix transcriptional regulator n=1 Tax=Natrarchaeobius versutus TaxID=1679078 RepID=UPI0035100E06